MRAKPFSTSFGTGFGGLVLALALLGGGVAHAQPQSGNGNGGGGGQQIDACTGYYYDPGGSNGDYGNNEHVTTTICPEGGPGSGPNTSVLFLHWDVAGLLVLSDRLDIYNGTTVTGFPIATGSNLNSLAGQSFTSSDPSGCLTFDWQSDLLGTASGWVARITTAPNPGTNTAVNICSAAPPFSLLSLLNGDPEPGGSWKDPGGASHGDTFDPAIDGPGIWVYTQSGPDPCPPASATLTITKIDAPDAGTNGTLELCANTAPVQLINFFGGTPDPGGTWTAPGGGPHSGTFDPSSDGPGVYTYTVAGTPPCSAASATVTVAVNQPPNAGTNGTITVCSNNAAFALFGQLGGTPDATGAWTGPGGGPVSGTYTPGTSTPGVYTYTVPGTPPCTPASATVTVAQTTAPNAGGNRSITVCSDGAVFSMRARLNGTPDAGGSWVGPGGPHGDTFDPATDVGGVYTYTVPGAPPCADASASLTITLHPAPDAGGDGSVTLCSTDGVFALFNALTGSPDVGGTWRDPLGQPHSGNFTPGTSAPGVYTYTVAGFAPCDPASAAVTVIVNTAPNAGMGAPVTRCSNSVPFDLFTLLGGSPDAGGTWTGPLGAHPSTFTPSIDPPGAYTYTVTGVAPCANATAVINVSIITAPDAGTDGSTTVCGNAAPFDLFDLLGGAPDGTGSWTAPGGGNVGGTFTPGTSMPGAYVYMVPGTAPCANASATVTVDVIAPPNPGTNGSITVCSNNAPVDLFSLLGGSPQAGGTWTRPNGTAHSGTYQPATEPGGNYTYTVAGTSPCTNLSAVVQVVRVIAPNAGVDGSITVCSTNGPFTLINVLSGSPNGTGSWLDPSLSPTSGTFTPGTSLPGVYAYIVPGTLPCANDTGFVTVNVNTAPNAGQNAAITVCSNNAPFPLFGQLGGTPDAGGTWTRPNGTPHAGTFVPGFSQPGGYTYTVPGLTPCLAASAVVVVSVNQQPNAGSNNGFTRCSTDGPVDLFNQLGGDPNTGGSWMGPGGPSSGVFIPGTSQPGAYTYTVVGVPPCTNATATVTATVNQAPNAGTGSTITVCQGTASVDLFTGLSGNPDLHGSWNDDDNCGQLSGNFVNTLNMPPGNYDFTYTVPGIGQCGDDQATVRITIVALLNAGSNSSPNACGSNTQVNLFNLLGGSPQPGGAWIDLDLTGAVSGQFFNASLVTPGVYHFRYRLTGILGCASDSAQVTLTVVAAPNAGTHGSTVTCSNSPPFPLFPFLGGTPQGGGQWRRNAPNGPPFSGTYDSATNDPGDFYYVVNGTPPCGSVNARVTVSEVQAPYAGGNASVPVCSDGTPFNMTAALNGSPDAGGSWYFNNQAHGALFVPGLDVQGIYEYRVPGQAPCNQAVAFLTVSVTPGADAGCNSSITVCSGAGQFLLFNALTCNPQNGGSWLDPDLLPYPSGTYTPGSSAPGDYYYIVGGAPPCKNDTAVVSVFETDSPNAGISNAAAFCGSAASPGPVVNLFTLLGGTPDPFGTWAGPAPGNPPFNGLFQPGVSTPGTYTYTVTNSCGSASATVGVSVTAPANAGCNRSVTVCSGSSPFVMVDSLGCSPSFGGQWTGPLPGTAVMNGFFTPGITAPGTYRYRITGTGACPNASAFLTVNVSTAAYAGNDANLQLCNTDGQVNLFPLLGPGVQPGGSWSFNSSPHSGIIQPSIDVTGTYVYRVTGTPPCADDEAFVFVQISAAPNAGDGGLVQTCSSAGPFALINFLSGGPQLNGNWTNPVGVPHSGIYDPAVDGPGLYKYRIPGNVGCDPDSAYVTVFEYDAVDAGGDAVTQVCSDAPPFALFGLLTGTPQPGGDWYAPDGSPSTGMYAPGISQPGAYKYKRIGTAPCASDSATVTVFENMAPDAGISTLAPLCSTQGPVALISLLGGTPAGNGSWTFSGLPHGSSFDPATDVPGPYLYTVTGAVPCVPASAQVVITVTNAAAPGSNGSLTACVGATAIPLFSGLGGTPTPGGTWTNNCGQGTLLNGVFDATGLSPGSTCTFTYTHAANGPCAATSALVTLNIVEALDAGTDNTSAACRGQDVDLISTLAGSPQSGGYWVNVDNAPGLDGGVFHTQAVPSGTTWRFDHVLPGSAQCAGDTARTTIVVENGPFAGCDGGTTVCSNSPPINLGTGLSCGPDAGGQWYGPLWAPHGAVFVPSTDLPGVYHYVVGGVGACPPDTANVTMNMLPAANAGAHAPLNICSTDAPVNMFTLLGPNAQTGGTWTCVTCGSTPHSGIYNPAIDAANTYQYTVSAAPPCSNAFALVTVTEPQAPNPGCDADVTLCSSQAPILMRTSLGCSPQLGGSWVYVTGGNVPHGNFFDPAVDLPGVYRYTVAGTAPCASASALLTVNVATAGNAGQNATVSACVTQTSVDLFATLGPGAQAGGIWTDQNNSQALSGNIFNPSVAGNGTWPFLYTILGNGPCPTVSSTVTVQVGAGSSAGSDSTVTVCGNITAYDLFTALGGTPTPGGTWSAPSGGSDALSPDGTLNMTLLPIGGATQFVYTVVDPGCGNVFANVFVTAAPFPVAGMGTTLTLCSTSAPVDLFAQLTGSPHTDGTWTDPASQVHGQVFVPGTDVEGNYTYTVTGTAPCANATATIGITVNDPPDAGADGELLACDTLTSLDLFTGLQGSPQGGGAWEDLDGGGGLTGGSLNTALLQPGEYRYRHTVTVVGCGSASAVVKVTVVTSVEVGDIVRTCIERDRTYTVSFTIGQGDAATYQVTGLPGTISSSAPYVFTSTPLFTSQGFEAFVRDRYACGTIRVAGDSPCDFDDDVFVPETFSPNGDGVNELFLIPGIEGYPTNTILIFNRWGAKMYEAAGYNNSSVVWDGTSPHAALAGPAPAGTYYYILDLDNGNTPITGYIYLNR